MRMFDHLVLCLHDLEAARRRFESFGFTVTPPAELPFGVRNRLVLLEDNFLELLIVSDPSAIPSAATDSFHFGAHNQAFLRRREGMSMLALRTSDARADARAFAARGMKTYAPLDFSREATLADGSVRSIAFSLAVATDPALPELAFFTCEHRQPREVVLRPAYQRHANEARRIVEVVLSAPEPAALRPFFEALLETEARVEPGILSFSAQGDRITLLARERLAERFPDCIAAADAPRFAAYRISLADPRALEQRLQSGGVRYRTADGRLVMPPDTAFGMAIELTADADSR